MAGDEYDRLVTAQDHQRAMDQAYREEMSDRELIARIPVAGGPQNEMELQRRLKVAVELLTAELVTFRESAEAAAARSDAAAARSDAAADRADAAAGRLERLTRWLIAFTIGLFVLTAIVAVLTGVLIAQS
jgi:hypothetical protein